MKKIALTDFVIPIVLAVFCLEISDLPAADRINLSVTNLTALEWDLLVAQDQGFFARQDLDVRITYMAPQLVINALMAGEANVAKSGTHFGILAATRGADLKIIGSGLYGYPYDLISLPEFRSLADLKGQKLVGGALGSITTIIFKDVMTRSGIVPSDYLLLVVPGSGTRFQALKSRQVAAAVAMAPPLNFSAIDSGMKVLLRYNDQVRDLQYLSYFVDPRFASANRSLITRFLRAVAQSQAWINNAGNEKEAARVLSRHLRIDENVASRTYRYMVTEGHGYRGEGKIDEAGLTEAIRLLAGYQLIPKRVPWQTFGDASFISTAVTSGDR